MELTPSVWRSIGLPALAAVILTVGCGEAPDRLSAVDTSEVTCADEVSRLDPCEEPPQLAGQRPQLVRLPPPEGFEPAAPLVLEAVSATEAEPVTDLTEIDGPLLTFETPRLEELCDLPPLPDELPASQEGDELANLDENFDEEVREQSDLADEEHVDDIFEFDEDYAEAYAPPEEMFHEPVFAENVAEANKPVIPQPATEWNDEKDKVVTPPGRVFDTEELDDDALLAAKSSADDVLAYFPAEEELSAQFRPQVQAAFSLARNGALHAARGRFESLLGDLARAKDASQMTERHSRALAAGLRALDEADDFRLAGGESEVDTLTLAAGHQTPMLRDPSVLKDKARWTLPHEAIAMYHRYAERKLAAAVAEEQAGSMALYGLGKIYQQLAERRDDVPQALRKSLTMYRGAVRAHEENHLAANEAGVLLARAGRYDQALPLLERAVEQANSSVTHQNLAFVHQKRGVTHLAHAHQREARKLATAEMSRGQLSAERGIAWMSPQDFNRRSRGVQTAPVASRSASPQATAPPARPQMATSPFQPPSTTPKTANRPRTLWW